MSVTLVVVAPLLWLYMRKNRPDAINDKMQKEFMKTIEHEDHPLRGRSRAVNWVLKRLGEDPMLAKFFPAHALHKEKHKDMGITQEQYTHFEPLEEV